VGEAHFYTSALATAAFLDSQKPQGTAYVIGEAGLHQALYAVGYSLTDVRPDYVVVGETRAYNFEMIEKAVRLVYGGARFIATNRDVVGPAEEGELTPACAALTAPIERATGRKPYFVGKPNALMMRIALRMLDDHSENAIMIGRPDDTDIEAGIESGMTTYLVLSGVTSRENWLGIRMCRIGSLSRWRRSRSNRGEVRTNSPMTPRLGRPLGSLPTRQEAALLVRNPSRSAPSGPRRWGTCAPAAGGRGTRSQDVRRAG